jgi:hypothetical protein
MNQFLTKENLWKKYQAARDWTKKWSEDFEEYDRIARNEAPDNVPEQYARVSDGTAAALVRKTPKRVIQQLPTGVVTTDDEDDPMAIVAEFILLHKILPDAKGGHDLIQKFWSTIENGLTFGGQAVYTPFVWNGSEFTADAKLIYYGDIFFQPGKTSFYDCDYFFIRSWWQPETIDQIIKKENALHEKAQAEGTRYVSSWDVKALKELKDHVTTKDQEGTTESEQRAGVSTEGIEIVTGFQKGKGATFLMGNPSSKKIVRRKKNRDPRGLPPVNYFYADVDNSNPFGRSIMSLIGGIQNMIDANMRAYMFNRALSLAPPIMARGNVDTSQAIYEPNSIIDLSSDPNASLAPLDVKTSAIQDYAAIYSLNKTQMLNIFNSGGDTSVSSDVGNPGFGKTPTALKQQKQILDAEDNYLRKNFESFFEDWAETAINVYFAEREGKEELQLDQKTADKLRDLVRQDKLPEGYVSEDNKVTIDYSKESQTLHFRVDASTSKLNGQAEQLEALQLILDFISSPVVTQTIPQEKIVLLYNSIVNNSGVLEPEKLKIDPKTLEEITDSTETNDPQAVAQALLQQGWPAALVNWAIRNIMDGKDPNEVYAQAERVLNDGR